MKAHFIKLCVLCTMLSLFSSCTSTSNVAYDPWEPVNRKIFVFNDVVDRLTLKPLAKGYEKAMPQVLQTGISNFFSNLGEINTVANDLLQGKFKQAGQDTLRFVINTVWGLGGLFDVAKLSGLEKHNEDLGQTLAVWGLDTSPYIVIPLLGPSTVVDGASNWATSQISPLKPILEIDHVPTRNTFLGGQLLDKRVQLLESDKVMEDAADRYAMQRSLYSQYRQSLIRDGELAEDEFEFEDDE